MQYQIIVRYYHASYCHINHLTSLSLCFHCSAHYLMQLGYTHGNPKVLVLATSFDLMDDERHHTDDYLLQR